MAEPRAAASKSQRSDRSVQTDARAKPARPDGGTASGALKAPVVGSSKSVTLEESVFGAEIKPHLVHETVRAELNAARSATRGGKSRGLVAGGRSKPWRQKGTGRARAGSTRAPHWTGGGMAFPPNNRKFTSQVNRKSRSAAACAPAASPAGRRRSFSSARATRSRCSRGSRRSGIAEVQADVAGPALHVRLRLRRGDEE